MPFLQIATAMILFGSLVTAMTAPDEVVFLVQLQEQSGFGNPMFVETPRLLIFGVDNRDNSWYRRNYTVYQRIDIGITHPNGTRVRNATLDGRTDSPCTSLGLTARAVEHNNATGMYAFL